MAELLVECSSLWGFSGWWEYQGLLEWYALTHITRHVPAAKEFIHSGLE